MSKLGQRIDNVRLWKDRTRHGLELTIFIHLVVVLIIAVEVSFGRVLVMNSSTQTIAQGTITVCGSEIPLHSLSPGSSQRIRYFLSQDSGYLLKYRMAKSNQSVVRTETGYVCPLNGLRGVDTFKVFEDHVEFSDRYEIPLTVPVDQ